ncbi:MAG: hypothetical protein LBJ72_11960 [Dysgonamonadaceae bacterium]|jgi:hypothetical protein|nr:hypothetical protein [Dysgonamonadaceae bacterium]
MEKAIIKVNIDSCLADFVINQLGSNSQPVKANRDTYVGSLLYRMLEKVPEDCRYIEPVLPRKRLLEIEVGSLGSRSETRKRPYTHYYFPVSRQREFESAIRDIFNELFFQIIEITKEYTERQYVELIENFCKRYGIDFACHFDALKKKHYRSRLEYAKNRENFIHARPVKTVY